MGHRTVKRVPMDFDAPLNKVWSGYIMPAEISMPDCEACEGSGYSPTARWLRATWYDHNVHGAPGWGALLHQEEVDALVEAGRLREWRKRMPTEENQRGGEWVTVTRSAEEVNAANGPGRSMFGDLAHDGINCHIAVEARCKRLGMEPLCEVCTGQGNIGTVEQREAWDTWVGSEPPVGEGWQLWETTSEGSPVTPVFASAADLADHCAEHATAFADMKLSAAEWLSSFQAETTDVDTLLVARVQ